MPEDLTYLAAGVNIDEAQRALRSVSAEIESTYKDGVVAGIGGFGGLFRASFPDLENPVLVSSIDGVGTKTKVAAMVGEFKGLGHDIVNHCANDILCQGARPLFFMDYFGSSTLSGLIFEEVLVGASEACREVGAALLGGETAEMPGVYHDEEIDIVGSIVGVVDFDKRLPRPEVRAGDMLVGIASNGLHTNGYSLARRALFEIGGLSVRDPLPETDMTLGEALLLPHRSYVSSVYPLLQQPAGIRAIAHITGGGLYDNLPRVFPSDVQALIERSSWTPLPIFRYIQEVGAVPDTEMYRAFNMGIGLVVVVDRDLANDVVRALNDAGEQAAIIGALQSGPHDVQII